MVTVTNLPYIEETNSKTTSESNTEVESLEVKAADEPKTGAENENAKDVKSEAQIIADAMVAKKLKNMPSKEEIAAFRKWKEEQKTEAERLADIQRSAQEAEANALKAQEKAEAMIAAARMGITPEHIDDAVILALAKTTDETSITEAIEMIAKNNPSWKTAVKLPENGSNPAAEEGDVSKELKTFF